MGDPRAIAAAKMGTAALGQYQLRCQSRLDLSNAVLDGCDLAWTNFAGANLAGASFRGARLTGAYFGPATFRPERPEVEEQDIPVRLEGARFDHANLLAATFNFPLLYQAAFDGAYLALANFRKVNLHNVSLLDTTMLNTSFCGCSFGGAIGIEHINHIGSSHVDIETLYRSPGLSRVFLSSFGIPDVMIEYLPDLISAVNPISFYSCFISHSPSDAEFCQLLSSRLRQEGIKVWYGPDDLRGGDRITQQVTEAIRIHDKVVIVLSDASIQDPRVYRDARIALRRERAAGRPLLFPISISKLSAGDRWNLPNNMIDKDVEKEIGEYFIPDFSDWRIKPSFDRSFQRFIRDLRCSDSLEHMDSSDGQSVPKIEKREDLLMSEPTRILFLAANPTSTRHVDLEGELRAVQLELRSTPLRERIRIVAHHAIQPDDLIRHVREERPAVVHFSGHGSARGIVLRTEGGGHQVVSGAALRRFFVDRGVQLVVLNACFTDGQAREIGASVRTVIGTSAAVDDEAARRFSVAFYRTLGCGLTVREAFRDGGDAVALHGLSDVFQHIGDLDWSIIN